MISLIYSFSGYEEIIDCVTKYFLENKQDLRRNTNGNMESCHRISCFYDPASEAEDKTRFNNGHSQAYTFTCTFPRPAKLIWIRLGISRRGNACEVTPRRPSRQRDFNPLDISQGWLLPFSGIGKWAIFADTSIQYCGLDNSISISAYQSLLYRRIITRSKI